jgi:hypothetical protein
MYIGVSIPSSVVNQLGFEYMEKRFDHRIVPTISFPTHALYPAILLEVLPKAGASILDASIRMDHQTPLWFSVASSALDAP